MNKLLHHRDVLKLLPICKSCLSNDVASATSTNSPSFCSIGESSLLARPNGQSRNYSRKLATQQATFWESYLRIDKCEDTKLQGHQRRESYDPACASYSCCLQCTRFFGLFLVLTHHGQKRWEIMHFHLGIQGSICERVCFEWKRCVHEAATGFEQYPPTRPHKSHSFP